MSLHPWISGGRNGKQKKLSLPNATSVAQDSDSLQNTEEMALDHVPWQSQKSFGQFYQPANDKTRAWLPYGDIIKAITSPHSETQPGHYYCIGETD